MVSFVILLIDKMKSTNKEDNTGTRLLVSEQFLPIGADARFGWPNSEIPSTQ